MNDALLWNEFGNIYLKMDLFDEAIAVYLKSIELNPDSGWTYSNLAYSYYKKGEYGRAISLYRISIPLLDNPAYMAITWNRLGDAFRALKDIDNAVAAYKKADDLEISPSLSTALANKPRTAPDRMAPPFAPVPPNGTMASEKNMVSDNKHIPSEHPVENRNNAASAPQTKDLHFTSGTRAIDNNTRRGDIKQNIPERLNTPVKPFGAKPIDAPSRTQGKAGDRTLSDANYEMKKSNLFVIPAPSIDQTNVREDPPATRSDPGPQPLESATEEKLPARPVQSGSKDASPCSKSESDAPTANNTHKLNSNINLEETLAKVNIYENITKANPNNDRAWDTLGKLYKLLGRFEDSIQAYKQAIDKAPGREVYYYYLGLLYSVSKQDEEAAWAFENVLKLNPDYVLAHSALAGIYRRMGFESKANDHINIALPKMNNESSYNLACFYAICGETDKALNYLQQALQNKDTTIEWVKSDPDLELLHNDSRYQRLIQEFADVQSPQQTDENYFSSGIDGTSNKLLPLLNNSLTR